MDDQAVAQLLGNYGEFLGAIAVFVTLIYLALQIKKTHQIALATLYQMRADAARSLVAQRLQSNELIKVFEKVERHEELTATDRILLDGQFFSALNHFESSHYLYQSGFLDEEHWKSDLRTLSAMFMESEYLRSYWERSRNGFRDSYVKAVDGAVRPAETSGGAEVTPHKR